MESKRFEDLSRDVLSRIADKLSIRDRLNFAASHKIFFKTVLPRKHDILSALQDVEDPIFVVRFSDEYGYSRYMFKVKQNHYIVIDGDLRFMECVKLWVAIEYAKHGYKLDMTYDQMLQALQQFARVLVSIDNTDKRAQLYILEHLDQAVAKVIRLIELLSKV